MSDLDCGPEHGRAPENSELEVYRRCPHCGQRYFMHQAGCRNESVAIREQREAAIAAMAALTAMRPC